MPDLFSGDSIFNLIMVIAVSLSLGLSITTLLLQIRGRRNKKNTPIKKVKKEKEYTQSVIPESAVNNIEAAPVTPAHTPVQPISSGIRRPIPSRDDKLTRDLFSDDPMPSVEPGFQLFIRETAAAVRDYEITVTGEFPIGRTVQSGLQINHETVSGVQCVFIAGTDSIRVRNVSRTNITLLNNKQLSEERFLNSGDVLLLGDVHLTILDIRKYAAS